MSIVGKQVEVVNENTGEVHVYTFTDTPWARWTGGILGACDAHGLTYEEGLAVLLYFQLFDREVGLMRHKLPEAANGIEGLIARGWMVRIKGGVRLLEVPETVVIANAGNAAMLFGPSMDSEAVN